VIFIEHVVRLHVTFVVLNRIKHSQQERASHRNDPWTSCCCFSSLSLSLSLMFLQVRDRSMQCASRSLFVCRCSTMCSIENRKVRVSHRCTTSILSWSFSQLNNEEIRRVCSRCRQRCARTIESCQWKHRLYSCLNNDRQETIHRANKLNIESFVSIELN
jgi:hypothetical protein